MNYDVFISYSRKDIEIADRICAAFDRASVTYFIDRQGIGGGLEFPDAIANAIVNSHIVLFLASTNSYVSKFTNSEITFAFNKKEKNSIIPYRIDNSDMPIGLQFVFSSINWRSLEEHPIEPILVNDVLKILGRSTNINKKYEVGDYYNEDGLEGVVYEVDDDGKTGKIVGLKAYQAQWCIDELSKCKIGGFSKSDGLQNMHLIKQRVDKLADYPIFSECVSHGDSWYVPSIDELKVLILHDRVKRKVDHVLESKGGDGLYCYGYWSSSEDEDGDAAWYLINLKVSRDYKKSFCYVRIVSRFPKGSYQIGDFYRDQTKEGIVVEVSKDKKHGKIIALNDLQGKLPWSINSIVDFEKRNNCGTQNLQEIKQKENWEVEYPAFAGCAAKGKEWYLPSYDELCLVYENKEELSEKAVLFGGQAFQQARYWSSSEYDSLFSWFVNFGNGVTNSAVKSLPLLIRPFANF